MVQLQEKISPLTVPGFLPHRWWNNHSFGKRSRSASTSTAYLTTYSKSLVRSYVLCRAASVERISVPHSNLYVRPTSWILWCSASQLSLDRFEAICNGWILDWKGKGNRSNLIAIFYASCINCSRMDKYLVKHFIRNPITNAWYKALLIS